MNEVDVTLESGRDRVGERANRFNARVRMGEFGEFGGKEGVGLADIDLHLQPVTRGRQRSGCQTVLFQPSVYRGNTV